jgi:hypothetical protein
MYDADESSRGSSLFKIRWGLYYGHALLKYLDGGEADSLRIMFPLPISKDLIFVEIYCRKIRIMIMELHDVFVGL